MIKVNGACSLFAVNISSASLVFNTGIFWCNGPLKGCSHSLQLMLALRAGKKTMMRCHWIDQVMMHSSPVDILPLVPSFADEVDELGSRFHTSTT